MIAEYRKSSGFLNFDMGIWKKVDLLTSQPIDDEIFASIKFISEVDKVGIKFFKDLGHRNPKESLLIFRAFIRQADAFYSSAKKLHYRASALLYYYAFLNLAKAYVCVSDLSAVTGHISHGLCHIFAPSNFRYQEVFVSNRGGVFLNLYKKETLINIPGNLKLNIKNLLGYCTSIAYEYEIGGFGIRKMSPVFVRMVTDENKKISWPVIAIGDFSLIKPYKETLKPFYVYFEQVNPDRISIREKFDISAESFSYYTYFQSKQSYEWQEDGTINMVIIKTDFQTPLTHLYDPLLHDDTFDFYLSAPLRIGTEIPMNQSLAIYVIMFYLGSLVRYNPSYLEKILNSKEAWLIERFINSAPEIFLRYISNAILKKNFIYKRI